MTACLRLLSIDSAISIIFVRTLSLWQSSVVNTSSGYLLLRCDIIAKAAKLIYLSLPLVDIMC